jgi:aryl-alcohol dehydrogenase-like predicted oxidoreductase
MANHEPNLPGRRAFLKAAALGGLALYPSLALSADSGGQQVPRRRLGKTGLMVSALSMGTMFDTITNQAVLRLALRLGIDYWDTAESYEGGRAEEGIGQYFNRAPGARSRVFLVTKSHTLERRADELSRHLAQSLTRMKTDYIDCFFVHGIDKIGDVNRPEIRQWAAEAKAGGRIKYFGFSTHRNMAPLLLAAAEIPWLDNIMFTYNYRVMHLPEMQKAVAAASAAGLGLVAMKTQGESSGITAGADDTGKAFEAQGMSPQQARLKAVWEDERIASVCSQMPNIAVMQANAAAALDKVKLSRQQWRALQDYAQATASDYCAGCAQICETILPGAAVADRLRALMYYRAYGQPLTARNLFASLSTDKGLSAEQIARARAACPQGIDLGEALQLAKRRLA